MNFSELVVVLAVVVSSFLFACFFNDDEMSFCSLDYSRESNLSFEVILGLPRIELN